MADNTSDANVRMLMRLVSKVGESLGSFRSGVQALLHGAAEDPELRSELLSSMEIELRNLQLLLDNIVQWKALERGVFKLRPRPVQLSSWLSAHLALWQEFNQDKRFYWDVAVPNDLPAVQIDIDRIGQALDNLISDATAYAPDNSVISITAGHNSYGTWIHVQSPAPYLEQTDYDQLFQPFYVGREYGRFPGRLGLGLVLSREFIDAHEGRLEFDPPDEEGGDLSFRLWLPLSLELVQHA